jgi:hypothetical protein
VNVSPVQIERTPSHRKIRLLESLLFGGYDEATRSRGVGATRGRPAQLVADAADVLSHVDGSYVNEAMTQPGDAFSGEALALEPSRGSGLCPLEGAALDAVVPAPVPQTLWTLG